MFSFALRDVSKSWIVLLFTILSLSVTFTVIFLTGGVLDGFKYALEHGVTVTEGDIKIHAPELSGNLEDTESLFQIVRQDPNIFSATVRSYGITTLEHQGTVLGPYTAMGVMVARESLTTQIPASMMEGRFIHDGETDAIVIGRTLADALVGLEYDGEILPVGEKVTLQSTTGNRKSYTVVGILDAKTFQPNWMMYLPKEELESLDDSGRNSEMVLRLQDPSQADKAKQSLQAQLPQVRVVTWRENAGYIGDLLTAIGFMTSNIKNLLIAATFIITSVTIFINMLQRRRQMGVVRSMGASRRFVFMIYAVESLLYPLLSLILGFLIFLFVYLQSSKYPTALLIGDFHLEFNEIEVLSLMVFLLLVPFFGGLVSAFLAMRFKIADALRTVE